MEPLWQLEKYGFESNDSKIIFMEDKRALNMLNITQLVDGQYEIGLLWIDKDPELSNNRDVVNKRLDLLGKYFKQKPEFARKYCKAKSDDIAKVYAKLLKTSYLSHHGVESSSKPGKGPSSRC